MRDIHAGARRARATSSTRRPDESDAELIAPVVDRSGPPDREVR
ncbi:hypothetical protein [Nakamurella sp.]